MTFNISGVNINGVNIYDTFGLYNFTTFTFQAGNVSGHIGANGTQLFSNSYSNVGNTWLTTTSFYNTYGNGYQFWTVPVSGNYTIKAAGARAGIPYFTPGNVANGNLTPGWGAIVQGTFSLTQGQILTLVVGQMSANALAGATYSSTGGGGASWVVTATGSPLLVAGGGGGGGNWSGGGATQSVKGGNGVTTTSGGASFRGAPGGTNGIGGNSHVHANGTVSLNGYDAGAGGGLYANGVSGYGANVRTNLANGNSGGAGVSFARGLAGGYYAGYPGATYNPGTSSGGFGGGGGASPITGGGGGGYSGGAGTYASTTTSTDAGGGGGSYIDANATNVATSDGNYETINTFNGSSITNIGYLNYGHGYITITRV
jgi:hypothetical protein